MSIADEKYVSLTTYRRDGTPKPLPVWIVDVGDGRVGLVTSSHSWKVKRLRNDPRVEVQPSNSRGVVKDGTTPRSGTAEIVEGAEFESVLAKVKAKYGWQLTAINGLSAIQRLIGRGGHTQDCAIVISLDDGDRT